MRAASDIHIASRKLQALGSETTFSFWFFGGGFLFLFLDACMSLKALCESLLLNSGLNITPTMD
jgi:hypothetical protein